MQIGTAVDSGWKAVISMAGKTNEKQTKQTKNRYAEMFFSIISYVVNNRVIISSGDPNTTVRLGTTDPKCNQGKIKLGFSQRWQVQLSALKVDYIDI